MLLGNDFLRDLILYRSIVLNLTSFYLTFSTWFELITFLLLLSSLLFSSFLFFSLFYSIWWLWVVCHIRWHDGPWLDYFEWLDFNATWYTSINAIFYVIRTSASVCEMVHTLITIVLSNDVFDDFNYHIHIRMIEQHYIWLLLEVIWKLWVYLLEE